MTTKVKMWGNSLGVHIPKHVSEELSLREGSDVHVSVQDDQISIRPIKTKKKITLKERIAKITDKNKHGDAWEGWVGPVGREIW